MKVRVRTLSNEEVEIETEPEKGESVASLKKKIENKWSHMPASRQRLVHAGKVLGDAQLLSDTSLKEGDRIVVMLTKAAPAGAPTGGAAAGTTSTSSSRSGGFAARAEAPAQASASTSRSSSAGGDSSGVTRSTTGSDAAVSSGASPAYSSASAAEVDTGGGREGGGQAPAAQGTAARGSGTEGAAAGNRDNSHPAAESVLQTGPQLEETLEQLVAMGFPRDRAEQAMRAAFNNPNRAVEYLMNGLPPDLSALLGTGGGLPTGDSADAAAAAEGLQQAVGDGDDEEGLAAEEDEEESATESSSNPLAALRRHPAFSQIRQMVQANPAMLPQVLQLIGSSNPQLLELITQNQDAFLEVLQQEDTEPAEGRGGGGGRAGGGAGQSQQQSGGGSGGDATMLGADPVTGVIQVTRDEMEALQRLEALGFTRHQAVEAYLACDRDEEMAANFLLENINDLEGEGSGGGSGTAD